MSIKIIETKRLVLRPFTLEDTESMFHHWASHQDNVTYVTWPAHDNQEITRKIISSWIKEERAGYHHWAIVEKDHQTLIGSISIVDHNEDTQTAEIGYILGKEYWGAGFMTEALKAVIASLFEKTSINRIQAVFDTENPASGKVMAKAGMIYEGTLRQASINNRGLVDIAIFAILKSDYLKEKTDDH
ncbi:GNAT family N-acetyltransferase [Streptococcus halotolerans]|uniref:GNAT family N-acetyltransferase n=1 Tax=Streptococcus halotolerans TaxID=1814128 RepID=UPI0007881C3F|nr:GNAT family N-acetyltransferase [Streptococcus halotolerans]